MTFFAESSGWFSPETGLEKSPFPFDWLECSFSQSADEDVRATADREVGVTPRPVLLLQEHHALMGFN